MHTLNLEHWMLRMIDMSNPTNPELKDINYDGETLHRVGCRACGGGDWFIFTNGKGKFVGYCFCGHKIEIAKAELVDFEHFMEG